VVDIGFTVQVLDVVEQLGFVHIYEVGAFVQLAVKMTEPPGNVELGIGVMVQVGAVETYVIEAEIPVES
jgi:hypothetical protein